MPIDQSLYPPLDQAIVACGTDESRLAAAQQFIELLGASGPLLAKYGFGPPSK
jgi:hypothetical protein